MRSNAPSADVVIEWSPGSVNAYDVRSGQYVQGSTLLEIAPKLSSREAVVGVSRRACFVRNVLVPDAPKEELLRALTVGISQHVPIDSADACVDLRLRGEAGPQGRSGTLIAMRAGDLRRLREEARQAGIRVLAALPAAYGSWIQANSASIKDCAAISETPDGVGVDLISGGELRYSRALGRESVNGRLAPELLRTFLAAGMKSVPTLAQGMPLAAADHSVERSPLEALAGTAWSAAGVEFELPETLASRKYAQQRRRLQMGAGLWVVAIALVGLAYFRWSEAQGRVNLALERSRSTLSQLDARSTELVSQDHSSTAMIRILEAGFKPAQQLGDVAALVSNCLPKGAWLTNLTVERGQVISVRGTALTQETVTSYVDQLAKEPRLRDVRLQFASDALIESTPVVNFSITAFPVGNLPLVEKTRARGANK